MMKRKILSFLIFITLVFTFIPANIKATDIISVELDGQNIECDTAPIIINDRVMVPMRSLFETFGADVRWHDEWNEVEAKKGSTIIRFRIGDEYANVNDEAKDMYGGSVIRDDRTLISTRFVAESLGLYVDWDDQRKTVVVSSVKRIPDKGKYCRIISATANNDDGNKPTNVFDSDYFTRWSSDLYGSELTLELEELSKVRYLGIAFYNGEERQTKFGVAVSEDGKNYNTVIQETQSHYGLNMEPIDLGAEYSAKFIKIFGYGNTSNGWTSITEIKAYSSQEDGSMPVDENGPGTTVKISYDKLPDNVKEALDKAETVFDGVIPWLANLYDPKTGGFYMALSGRDDPTMSPGLEMTSWGIGILNTYTDCFDDIPSDIKQKFIDFYNDRQDPETGFYIDKQGPANERETARNQSTSLSAMSQLHAEPIYKHPSKEQQTADASNSSVIAMNLPDYMKSVNSYINWVSSFNWATSSWGAGDSVQASQAYLKALPKDQQNEYVDALFNWLDSHQDPKTGLWANGIDFNSVSGAFKNGLTYATWGRKMPNADKIVESIIECYKTQEPDSPYYIRNPLSVLGQIAGYSPELKTKVQDAVVENIDSMTSGFNHYKCPDGAFSAGYKKSMKSFGGVVGSHELYEGDIDATLMILIARNALYSIFDVIAPRLKADKFWDWITEKEDIPSPYADESVLEEGNTAMIYDFENFDLETKISGREFGGSYLTTYTNAEIVADSDRKDNKILELKYDGKGTAGPALDFANNSSQILFKTYKKVIAEYEIKVRDMQGTNNFYVHYGSLPSFAISSSGTGVQKVSYRVGGDKISYGNTIVTMSEDEWYKIRAEYEMTDDNSNAFIKMYVDGNLVGDNSYYFGSHLGNAPVSMDKLLRFYFYKAGRGTVYLDNIKIYSE